MYRHGQCLVYRPHTLGHILVCCHIPTISLCTLVPESFSPDSSKASPPMCIPGNRSSPQLMTLGNQCVNTAVPSHVGLG